jgi:hypothetical protein
MATRQAAQAEAFKPLEVHWNKEAIHGGLASANIVPIEDPIVSVLAWKRNPDRDLPIVAVDHVIIVGYSMDLIRSKMVNVLRAATGLLHPMGDSLSVRPIVMRLALAAIQ